MEAPAPSRPSWARGLKLHQPLLGQVAAGVAPLVGAWIEMRGRLYPAHRGIVAPLVGAWIEISTRMSITCIAAVAPLVGAWIEILAGVKAKYAAPSRPSWARGLKSPFSRFSALCVYVAPLVGAWIEMSEMVKLGQAKEDVAPLVGAWIEIR